MSEFEGAYRGTDCPNCGRNRVELDGICEKCHWNEDLVRYADTCRNCDRPTANKDCICCDICRGILSFPSSTPYRADASTAAEMVKVYSYYGADGPKLYKTFGPIFKRHALIKLKAERRKMFLEDSRFWGPRIFKRIDQPTDRYASLLSQLMCYLIPDGMSDKEAHVYFGANGVRFDWVNRIEAVDFLGFGEKLATIESKLSADHFSFKLIKHSTLLEGFSFSGETHGES